MQPKFKDLTPGLERRITPRQPKFITPERRERMGAMSGLLREAIDKSEAVGLACRKDGVVNMVGLLFSSDHRDRVEAACSLRYAQAGGVDVTLDHTRELKLALKGAIRRIEILKQLHSEGKDVPFPGADLCVRDLVAKILGIKLLKPEGATAHNCNCEIKSHLL